MEPARQKLKSSRSSTEDSTSVVDCLDAEIPGYIYAIL